jgi:CBS-domain-containing membrane protein
MPHLFTAQPHNLIGGHLLGLISGWLAAAVPHHSSMVSLAVAALAVGLSIFLMVSCDMEHPPASGTALGVANLGFS